MNQMPEKYVITVGRQMGSGGRRLGKLIADRLGIAYYDKELLRHAAEQAGLCPEFFERNDERRPSFISGIFTFAMGVNPLALYDGASTIGDDVLYKAQCDFIRTIADQGPCVIVGRSADYVLRDKPNVVNIFVHASLDDRAARIVSRNPEYTLEQARVISEKTNKLRAGYYNFYTDKRWGDAASYDLTMNSSVMSLEEIADFVAEYARRRFAADARRTSGM